MYNSSNWDSVPICTRRGLYKASLAILTVYILLVWLFNIMVSGQLKPCACLVSIEVFIFIQIISVIQT